MNGGTISGRALNVKQLSFLQKIKLRFLLSTAEPIIPEVKAAQREIANAGGKVKNKLEPETDLFNKIFT